MGTGPGTRQSKPVSRGYLYGDSSPSPLQGDFIAFLRDAFDFSTAILVCDARVSAAQQRVSRVSEATDREIERAEAFAADVARFVERANVGDPDSLAGRCAARLRHGIKDLVRAEAETAQTAVLAERTRAAQVTAAEQEGIGRALETLLLRQQLPDSIAVVRVHLEAAMQYDAQLHGRSTYGLEWVVSLEVPPSHPLAHVLRVDRVVERLEVDAPEEAGWLRKETKIRPQRLDRLHVVELTVDPTETSVKLRTTPEGYGVGFDLLFERDSPQVQLTRTPENGVAVDAAYEVTGDDAAKLREFEGALIAMARDLMEHKKELLVASLDDVPIRQIESPRVLVDRLLANIAPTVQEIARRSLAPGELVIKRLLSNNAREELFVSKAELRQKLAALPPTLHSAFDALGLWDTGSPAEGRAEVDGLTSAPGAVAPAPAPSAFSPAVAAPSAPAPAVAAPPAPPSSSSVAPPPVRPSNVPPPVHPSPVPPAPDARVKSERPPGAGLRAPRPDGLTTTQPYPLPVPPEVAAAASSPSPAPAQSTTGGASQPPAPSPPATPETPPESLPLPLHRPGVPRP
jgi:hypothetical protein